MKNPVQFFIIWHVSIIAILAKLVCFKNFILIGIFSPVKSDALGILQKLRKKLKNTKGNFNIDFGAFQKNRQLQEFLSNSWRILTGILVGKATDFAYYANRILSYISLNNFKVISLNGVYSNVNKECIQGRRNFRNLGGNKPSNVISVICP